MHELSELLNTELSEDYFFKLAYTTQPAYTTVSPKCIKKNFEDPRL